MSTATIAQGPVDVPVGPVAWAVFADNGNIRIWSSASEPVRKLAEAEGMKLVPLYAIPDGFALVPIELPKEITRTVNKDHGYPSTPIGVWWKWLMQAMGHLPHNLKGEARPK